MAYFKIVFRYKANWIIRLTFNKWLILELFFTYKAHWIIRRTFLFLENVMLSGAPYSAENTVQLNRIKIGLELD